MNKLIARAFCSSFYHHRIAVRGLSCYRYNMDTFVRQLIQNKDADEKIFSLSDISSVRIWNYELPTLTRKGRFTNRQHWNSSDEFREAFLNKFEIFESVDLTDIAIMGGCVFDILHLRENSISDIDMFLVGDAYNTKIHGIEAVEQRIIQRAEKFIDDIYKFLEETVKKTNAEKLEANKKYGRAAKQDQVLLSNYINEFKATRNGPVITLHIPTVNVPVQFVLAPHDNIQTLLRRADLDITAIAFYNDQVCFNSVSKFCYENACTIIGKTKHHSFEKRVIKYFDKGIDIILPALDEKKIPQKNLKYHVAEVVDLNYLAIVYDEVTEKKICALTMHAVVPEIVEPSATTANNTSGKKALLSGDGGNGYGASSDGKGKNSGLIIHENIIYLLHDLPEKFQFYGEGKFVKDVLLPIPKFTNRMITNTFETVRDELNNFANGTFEIPVLEKYFSVKNSSQILTEILLLPLQENEKEEKNSAAAAVAAVAAGDSNNKREIYSLFGKDYENKIKNYWKELITQQIQETHEKLKQVELNAKNHPEKYKIVSENCFVDLVLNEKEWYGERYLL